MKSKEKCDCQHINPLVRVGDEVLLIEGRNGNASQNGQVGKVTQIIYVCGMTDIDYFYVTFPTYSGMAIYTSRRGRTAWDKYTLATREVRAKRLEEQIAIEQVKVDALKSEHKRLVEFKDDEAEVAHNLQMILKAKGETAIADILREMKRTHYL
jgi:hypothetical protein